MLIEEPSPDHWLNKWTGRNCVILGPKFNRETGKHVWGSIAYGAYKTTGFTRKQLRIYDPCTDCTQLFALAAFAEANI
jgi:hypothetical protein